MQAQALVMKVTYRNVFHLINIIAMAPIPGPVVTNILVNIRMIKDMVKGLYILKMVVNMKVNTGMV